MYREKKNNSAVTTYQQQAKFSGLFSEIQMLGKYKPYYFTQGQKFSRVPCVSFLYYFTTYSRRSPLLKYCIISPLPGCTEGSRQLSPCPLAVRGGHGLMTFAGQMTNDIPILLLAEG